MKHIVLSAALAAGALFAPAAVSAQKADDTLRMAFQFPITTVDAYLDYKPETEMVMSMVFDGLIQYDEAKGEYAPLLASEWSTDDNITWTFKLRDDVKWQDGEPFDADDVVYTFDWLTAESTAIRNKPYWSWVKEVRKVDPYTVEIEANNATPIILPRLAYGTLILPEHVHGPLEDKLAFRDNFVGTGPYKVQELSQDGKLTLVKSDSFNHGAGVKGPAQIGTFVFTTLPDLSAQTAALLAGDIDVVRNVSFEEAQGISADPRFAFTLSQSISYMYLQIDVNAVSGAEALKDERVRKAIMMSIDRDALDKARTGGAPLERYVDHICWKFQTSCAFNEPLPAFDPEGAKALLAEAGYADGLKLNINTFGSTKDYAEIVSGFLRKVGIEANVIAQSFAAYRQSQADGEFQLLVAGWNAGSGPDGGLAISNFFSGDPRDMLKDAAITEKMTKIMATMPGEERDKLMADVLDASVERAYMIPLTGIPVVFLHTADVQMKTGRNIPFAADLTDFSWVD